MPLVIDKTILVNYFTALVGQSYLTMEEKRELGKNFDFQYELDSLIDKYFQYFDNKDNEIVFDNEYIDELGNLIEDEMDEYDVEVIQDIDFVIEGNIILLDILGVKINKDLYNFLLDIEKEIEDYYNDLYVLETNIFDISKSKKQIIDEMRKLYLKKIVMFLNTKNLLSYIQYYDLMQYSSSLVDRINEDENISLMYEDDQFNEADIVRDVYLRSIFTGGDSYISNLDETFIMNFSKTDGNEKYNKIRFYVTLLDLLDKEINGSIGFLKSELVKIKYRLMNVLDSVCGTMLFINKKVNYNNNYREDYNFASDAVCYFIKELLMYDDEKYRNKENDTDNVMVYIDNIMKKLFIETYYELTSDKMVIREIKCNELYGVNGISSGFLKNIIDKPKIKIKEV